MTRGFRRKNKKSRTAEVAFAGGVRSRVAGAHLAVSYPRYAGPTANPRGRGPTFNTRPPSTHVLSATRLPVSISRTHVSVCTEGNILSVVGDPLSSAGPGDTTLPAPDTGPPASSAVFHFASGRTPCRHDSPCVGQGGAGPAAGPWRTPLLLLV